MSDKIVSIASSKPTAATTAVPIAPSAQPVVKFEVGEVVQLQSGGPPMTIRKSSKTNVIADWLLDSGELCSAAFEPPMLLLCPSDEPYDEGDDLEVEVTLDGSPRTVGFVTFATATARKPKPKPGDSPLIWY